MNPNGQPSPSEHSNGARGVPVGAEVPAAPNAERVRLLALTGLTVALVGLCIVLAVPFLPALTWSVALAIIAWPLHQWVSRRIVRPGLAAAVSSAAVVAMILLPGLLVSYQLAREAATAAEHIGGVSADDAVRAQLAQTPVLGGVAEWLDRAGLDLEQEGRKVIGSYIQDAAGLFHGSLAVAVQFLAALFVLFHLFRDRAELMRGARDLLPLSRAEWDLVFRGAADSVHANLYATLVTSTLDAVGGGLIFWALGLRSPLLWGVVMFVLSILPVVGTAFIWLPAVAYLGLEGRWLAALALVAWGVGSWCVVDNIIYVRLAGERMRMHQVPALISFLGGLAVFGVSGMILGPAILAVTVAVLDVWRRRHADAKTGLDATAVVSAPEPGADGRKGHDAGVMVGTQ